MNICLTYASGAYDLRGKVMGRQAAGVGFLRALAGSRLDEIGCYAASEDLARILGQDLGSLTSHPMRVRYIARTQPQALRSFDTLYRADPSLGDEAWIRQEQSGARAYSLCGVTHTLSSRGVMQAISALPEMPLYSWDAVICTSRVARDLVLSLVERRCEHLRSRFGVSSVSLPQLPLIPLGVHSQDFAASPQERVRAREDVGLKDDEVAVLFAGRLTFHAKAHPLPMLLGLQRAVEASRVPTALLLFGQFPNAAVEAAFREEAALLAPSIRLIVLDGVDAANGPRAWAAADVFTSLSDNIQETFGLTPVEAMAAGLPCVVSDWNGYKDTVRDGVDGFRVPVHIPPPGCGTDLADRFSYGENYDGYIGEVSLFTAVDVSATAEAYLRLITSPDLRRTMGEAGRKRVAERFDWSIVFRRYLTLWEELGERRRSDPRVAGETSRARRPDWPDPFDLFQTFPTATIGRDTRIRLAANATSAEAISRKQLKSVGYAAPVLPSDGVVTKIIDALSLHTEGTTVGALQEACAPMPLVGIIRSLAFLSKMAIVDVIPTS